MSETEAGAVKAWRVGWSRDRKAALVCVGAMLALAAIAIADAAIFGVRVQRVPAAAGLQDYFRDIGYTRSAVTSAGRRVPRIYIADFPAGWADGTETDTKKDLFFMSILPIVLKTNELIAAQRARLLALQRKQRSGFGFTEEDRDFLGEIAAAYETGAEDARGAPLDADERLRTLARRVDTIPPSLALAQAAVESGYGTSRFAVAGNALFGQWGTGGGIRPRAQRPEHLPFRVAEFASPLRSAIAYARNLNTFPAYRGFRLRRAAIRSAGRTPGGRELAGELAAYSEKGARDVAVLRRIIRENRLERFDGARLAPGRPVLLRL